MEVPAPDRGLEGERSAGQRAALGPLWAPSVLPTTPPAVLLAVPHWQSRTASRSRPGAPSCCSQPGCGGQLWLSLWALIYHRKKLLARGSSYGEGFCQKTDPGVLPGLTQNSRGARTARLTGLDTSLGFTGELPGPLVLPAPKHPLCPRPLLSNHPTRAASLRRPPPVLVASDSELPAPCPAHPPAQAPAWKVGIPSAPRLGRQQPNSVAEPSNAFSTCPSSPHRPLSPTPLVLAPRPSSLGYLPSLSTVVTPAGFESEGPGVKFQILTLGK